MSDAPLRRLWNRVKDEAPRQKTLAAVTATVRKTKPRTAGDARTRLLDEAARRGLTDLTDKELRVMVETVTTSAKEATTQAVSTGTAKMRAMWAGLQQTTPTWTELPDDIAAFPIRSDQQLIKVTVDVDSPFVMRRLYDDLPADSDGERSLYVWLSVDDGSQAVLVHVGKETVGHVPDTHAAAVRDTLARRRGWVPAAVRGTDAGSAWLAVELPDRA